MTTRVHDDSYRATGPQIAYLRRLLDEAFAKGYPGRTGLNRHHLGNVTRAEASQTIDRLKAAQARGWTADPVKHTPILAWPGKRAVGRPGYSARGLQAFVDNDDPLRVAERLARQAM